jgi:hypothetical protein
MEGIARKLDHLGLLDRNAKDRRLDLLVDRLDHGARAVVDCADDREGRRIEIGDRAGLTQELRVHRQAEAVAGDTVGARLQRLADLPAHGPRENRASHDDEVFARAIRQLAANLVGHVDQRVQPGDPLRGVRRTDADK